MQYENWNRIIGRLSNCDDTDTQKLSQYLGISCDTFNHILLKRGHDLNDSVYSEQLNYDKETRFINEVVNPTFQLMVDPVKWIDVIEHLRFSLRSQYQQPVPSFEDQDYSRGLEFSPPSGQRATPATRLGKSGADIPTYTQMEEIKRNLDIIFDKTNDPNNAIYKQMILRVLGTTSNVTSDEDYELIFGGPYTKLIAQHTLTEIFNKKFSYMDANEALEFACRAYLRGTPDEFISLGSNKLHVIACLMRSFATDVFDRTPHGGKSRLRSKKRGRKSIHRRKKSMHKKRK